MVCCQSVARRGEGSLIWLTVVADTNCREAAEIVVLIANSERGMA